MAGDSVALRSVTDMTDVQMSGEEDIDAGHSALVVQAGTMSTRKRGEASTMNVLRMSPAEITIERHSWDEETLTFETSWHRTFRRTEAGWF